MNYSSADFLKFWGYSSLIICCTFIKIDEEPIYSGYAIGTLTPEMIM
ncbi:Uncharacterised protein [Sphingobacterium multivorum]|nr:Uncharacterised protein [Sphingobacterium multivorum]